MDSFAQDPFEGFEKDLLGNAMKRNWQQVIKKYNADPRAHTAQINWSGATALHFAISDEQEYVVEELVCIIAKSPEALKIQDELGNTPLHLAAYQKSGAKMCRCIAEKDPTLIGIRNKNTDTPLFLAVVHGRKDAFLCMHDLCEDDKKRYEYCRKTDGESILHCAIYREHFDLAYPIVHLYEDLMHSRNDYGVEPMHVLATKPDAFKSGCYMGIFHKLIYHCVPVKKLKPSEIPSQDPEESSQTFLGFIPRLISNITRTRSTYPILSVLIMLMHVIEIFHI